MKSPSPAWFFTAAGLHPPYALLVLAALVGMGVWTTRLSAADLDSGLGMLLFVQMFLASSGFMARARHGHFDPLLIGSAGRTRALVWHWLISIAPGVAGWICLAGAGYAFGSPAAGSALIGSRAAAFFIVSATAWAAGVALPRGAAGVVWMAALLGLLVQRVELLPSHLSLTATGTALRHAGTLLVCPFLLVGNHPPLSPGAIWAAALSSALVLLLVLRQAERLDFYLVDRA